MKKIIINDLGSRGETFNAEITPKVSIRIFGTQTNRANGPIDFDKTFVIGDEVVYGSYNLIYTGKITRIGPKTITVKHYEHTDTTSRMKVSEFVWRNWDFNAEEIQSRNSDTMMRI